MAEDSDAAETEQRGGMDRRRFVKTAALAGTAGAAAAGGALTFFPLSRPGESPPKFKYWGLRVVRNPGTREGSKAPRGIPIIPVRTNDAGELYGVPDHLEWYKYCGRNNAPGVDADFATDNVFRYRVDRQVLEATKAEGIDAWYESRLQQKALLSDFDDVAKGAPALWRSEGVEAENPLTVVLLRVDTDRHDPELVERFFPDGVLAAFATCAHLCLVPTWRASRVSYGDGAWDVLTCFGHGSWYDPYQIVEYDFPPTG